MSALVGARRRCKCSPSRCAAQGARVNRPTRCRTPSGGSAAAMGRLPGHHGARTPFRTPTSSSPRPPQELNPTAAHMAVMKHQANRRQPSAHSTDEIDIAGLAPTPPAQRSNGKPQVTIGPSPLATPSSAVRARLSTWPRPRPPSGRVSNSFTNRFMAKIEIFTSPTVPPASTHPAPIT